MFIKIKSRVTVRSEAFHQIPPGYGRRVEFQPWLEGQRFCSKTGTSLLPERTSFGWVFGLVEAGNIMETHAGNKERHGHQETSLEKKQWNILENKQFGTSIRTSFVGSSDWFLQTSLTENIFLYITPVIQ